MQRFPPWHGVVQSGGAKAWDVPDVSVIDRSDARIEQATFHRRTSHRIVPIHGCGGGLQDCAFQPGRAPKNRKVVDASFPAIIPSWDDHFGAAFPPIALYTTIRAIGE
jgi:hypothetical protein